MLKWRGELFEQQRELREFLVASAHRWCARTVIAGEPPHHMHCVVGTALFPVVDDIDAALDLFVYNVRDCVAHGALQFCTVRARVLLFGQQQLHHFRRARQAAGVGCENAAHFRTRA